MFIVCGMWIKLFWVLGVRVDIMLDGNVLLGVLLCSMLISDIGCCIFCMFLVGIWFSCLK